MKQLITALCMAYAAAAFASARIEVSALPQSEYADTEVSTNVALNVSAARLERLTLSVAFETSETNEVLVALGADTDGNGDLSIDEADVVFGCDCGAGAGRSRRIQGRNRWTVDEAGGGLYRNWSAGQLTWNIPIGWGRLMSDQDTFGVLLDPEYEKCANSNTRALLIGGRSDIYTQKFQIDDNGKARIDKIGHWLSRTRHCHIILDGKTVQWTHPLW